MPSTTRLKLSLAEIEKLEAYVIRCGGEVLPPLLEGEIIRIIAGGETLTATADPDGTQHWPELLVMVYANQLLGGAFPRLSSHGTSLPVPLANKAARVRALARRDGWSCWYCTTRLRAPWHSTVLHLEIATIEELCSRAIGGPTHIHNQVLACSPCNNRASTLAIVDKLALRERMRTELAAKVAAMEAEVARRGAPETVEPSAGLANGSGHRQENDCDLTFAGSEEVVA